MTLCLRQTVVAERRTLAEGLDVDHTQASLDRVHDWWSKKLNLHEFPHSFAAPPLSLYVDHEA